MSTQIAQLSDETRDQLAELALRLGNNAKTRKGFLGLVKEASPETPIPEIDVQTQIDGALKNERDAREKVEKDFADFKFGQQLERTRGEAKAKYQMSDEDMSKMEEMMKKGELPADYRFAPQLFRQQTEVAQPTNYGSGGYGPLDIEHNAKGLEGLMEDTDNWASRTAHQMIDDMHKRGKAPSF